MVVGGYTNEGSTDTTELIDLDSPYGPSLDCIRPAPYPYVVYGAAGGVLNNKPIVCGGRSDEIGGYLSDCHQYNQVRIKLYVSIVYQ